MFERAGHLATIGARLLFYGAPGGGKSTMVRALAKAMEAVGAAGPPLVVEGATILARGWGATERILAQMFRQADVGRSPLIIDELDALCGVRDPSSSSGNAYLVRTLTDEFLRRLDAHPRLAVLATCNDPAAVDPAVRRRFAGQYHVGAELPAPLERRAWTSLLGCAPPAGWAPIGAALSDFVAATLHPRRRRFPIASGRKTAPCTDVSRSIPSRRKAGSWSAYAKRLA